MVTFWDTSAVVPLLVVESSSAILRPLARDLRPIVWWGTAVECFSALSRRERDGSLDTEVIDRGRRRLRMLRESWLEILPSQQVRDIAERLLLRHPLRAADALQLGAALRWISQNPAGHGFLTLDRRLADAARREGFDLVDVS